MLETLKKAIGIFDVLILAGAAYLLTRFDYSNLQISEMIYIGGFVLWLIMFFVRIFIVYQNLENGDKK